MQQNVLIFKSQETNYRKHFSNNYEICSEKGERAYEKKEETAGRAVTVDSSQTVLSHVFH